MNLRLIVAGIAILLIPVVSGAQSEDQSDAAANLATLFEEVNSVAGELEGNITALQEALNESIHSMEEGALLLDQMEFAVKAVYERLAEDSEIWTSLVKATELWGQREQEMLEKSEANHVFEQIAKEWGVKVQKVGVLRDQILTQRAESTALLDQLVSDREVVLAYFELDQADRALEAMQKVSDDLGQMNNAMRTIVEQTKEVAGPSIPQQ